MEALLALARSYDQTTAEELSSWKLFNRGKTNLVPSILTFLPAGRARSARLAGPKIALRSRVCVFVCVRPHLSHDCELRNSVTMPL